MDPLVFSFTPQLSTFISSFLTPDTLPLTVLKNAAGGVSPSSRDGAVFLVQIFSRMRPVWLSLNLSFRKPITSPILVGSATVMRYVLEVCVEFWRVWITNAFSYTLGFNFSVFIIPLYFADISNIFESVSGDTFFPTLFMYCLMVHRLALSPHS